ncbi:MAG: hypothetical protein JWR51_2104 [Devosia sp.]|jgi:uncharacterized protein YraI|uniref:SH3 domain-containing protein n=1 Tax=Devosia sp. TaxID=1871048 RepID=UPI002624A5B2|nr:SH3 domain-containing protein [Devosia sp.]MDB5529001.1 hypothetical protein [Devosia sp.]
MNKFTTALLAAAVLVASASAAMASPGVVTGNANVRAGAGTGYPVISSVQYGQAVDIDYCSGNWCHVSKPGRDGWVSASYLATDNGWGRDRHHRRHTGWGNNGGWGNNHGGWNTHNTVGINTCVSGQNASFCVGF